MKFVRLIFAIAMAVAIPAFAQQPSVDGAISAKTSATSPVNVFAEWLKKDSFKVRFVQPGTTFVDQFYEMHPKGGQGFTYFYGWKEPWCVNGGVPTTFSLTDDGRMLISFNFKRSGCPVIRYEFKQDVGAKGQVFLQQGDQWELRVNYVELVGYDVDEYRKALAATHQTTK